MAITEGFRIPVLVLIGCEWEGNKDGWQAKLRNLAQTCGSGSGDNKIRGRIDFGHPVMKR
jgi:hypothetical protein